MQNTEACYEYVCILKKNNFFFFLIYFSSEREKKGMKSRKAVE